MLLIFFLLLGLRLYVVKTETVWYVCYYITSTVAGLWCVLLAEGDLLKCAVGNLSDGFPQLYYQTQMAFYLATFVFITCIDRENPDNDWAMVVHHLATLTIIFVSYIFGFQRVGLVVLALHDVTDIFLYLSKYWRDKYTSQAPRTQVAFGAFVVTFVLLRLVFFPWFVFGRCISVVTDVQHAVAFGGLVVLLGLHGFWFTQIVPIVGKVFF